MMRDYTKLIKALRCFNVNYDSNKLTNDAADAIEELLAAVNLPEHGDLIDRDAFDADARKRYCSACDNYNGLKCRACWVDDMLGDVADFETVIPSNKEDTP